MRMIGIAALAAATFFATGASAQVGLNVGPGGVSVGVGEPGYHRHYRDGYRYRDRDWRRSRGQERVIIKERRDGSRKVIREYRY